MFMKRPGPTQSSVQPGEQKAHINIGGETWANARTRARALAKTRHPNWLSSPVGIESDGPWTVDVDHFGFADPQCHTAEPADDGDFCFHTKTLSQLTTLPVAPL
jgi:hypothetical protein